MSILAHRFTSISRVGRFWSLTGAAAAILIAMLGVFAGIADLRHFAVSSNNAAAESIPSAKEYGRLLTEAELVAASTDRPYLILDVTHHTLQLKLHGAELTGWPFETVGGDSTSLLSFADAFTAGRTMPARSMSYVHLFKARPLFSDSMLAIVAEALTISPELLQRYEPAHLALSFGEGFFLHVQADVPDADGSLLGNGLESVRESIAGLPGGASLTIRLHTDDAVSLYGACRSVIVMLVSY